MNIFELNNHPTPIAMVYMNKAAWALPSYCSRIQVAVTIGGYFYGFN